jgi:hypothetical protein
MCQPHVLLYVVRHIGKVGDVGFAKIDVVIEPGSRFECLMKEASHDRSDSRIDCKKRAEQHYIIRTRVRQFAIQYSGRMIFVKGVMCIIVFVEEGEGYMRFGPAVTTDIAVVHTVFAQIAADYVTYMVVACLCDHTAVYACTPEGHDTIEC